MTELKFYTILAVLHVKTERPVVKGSLVFGLACTTLWRCLLCFVMSHLTCTRWKFGSGTTECVSQWGMLEVQWFNHFPLQLSPLPQYCIASCVPGVTPIYISTSELCLCLESPRCFFFLLFDFSRWGISNSCLTHVASSLVTFFVVVFIAL